MNESSTKNTMDKEIKIILDKSISVSGVTNVIDSTNECITLQIGQSNQLIIEGANLSMTNLDLANAKIDANGKVYKLKYATKENQQSIKKRLFK